MRKSIFIKTMYLLAVMLMFFNATGIIYAAKSNTQTTAEVNFKTDKNNNGIPDSWEHEFKLTGKNVANGDADGDGLTNIMEFKLKMNPKSSDSDNDGIKDGDEDNDHDGINDGQEDQDGDGLPNMDEIDLQIAPVVADSNNSGV
jgi:hypothetical protein